MTCHLFVCLSVCVLGCKNQVTSLLPAHTHHLVEQLVTEVSQNQQITECLLPVLQIKISYKQTHIYVVAQHILTYPKKKKVCYLDQQVQWFLTRCSQTFLSSPSGFQWL